MERMTKSLFEKVLDGCLLSGLYVFLGLFHGPLDFLLGKLRVASSIFLSEGFDRRQFMKFTVTHVAFTILGPVF
jgi:hypothetical protein